MAQMLDDEDEMVPWSCQELSWVWWKLLGGKYRLKPDLSVRIC